MTDHSNPESGQNSLPEGNDDSLALSNDINNIKKPYVAPKMTETRFIDAVNSGFEPAEIAHLTESQQDELALRIANEARSQWNDARRAEVTSNRAIEAESTQEAMATEIFNAVMEHLHSIPSAVRVKVIHKFQSLPSHKYRITL